MSYDGAESDPLDDSLVCEESHPAAHHLQATVEEQDGEEGFEGGDGGSIVGDGDTIEERDAGNISDEGEDNGADSKEEGRRVEKAEKESEDATQGREEEDKGQKEQGEQGSERTNQNREDEEGRSTHDAAIACKDIVPESQEESVADQEDDEKEVARCSEEELREGEARDSGLVEDQDAGKVGAGEDDSLLGLRGGVDGGSKGGEGEEDDSRQLSLGGQVERRGKEGNGEDENDDDDDDDDDDVEEEEEEQYFPPPPPESLGDWMGRIESSGVDGEEGSDAGEGGEEIDGEDDEAEEEVGHNFADEYDDEDEGQSKAACVANDAGANDAGVIAQSDDAEEHQAHIAHIAHMQGDDLVPPEQQAGSPESAGQIMEGAVDLASRTEAEMARNEPIVGRGIPLVAGSSAGPSGVFASGAFSLGGLLQRGDEDAPPPPVKEAVERGQRSGWGNKFKRPDKQVQQQQQQQQQQREQQQQGGIEQSEGNQGQEKEQQRHCQPGAERVNKSIERERSSSDPRVDSSASHAPAVAHIVSPSVGEPKDERRIRLSFAAPHR